MSSIGSTSATSSTAQHERVASNNSQQARRQSGDQRTFANMLAAAADSAAPEALADVRKKARTQAEDADADADAQQFKANSAQIATADPSANAVHPTDDATNAGPSARGVRATLSTLTQLARDAQTAMPLRRGSAADKQAGGAGSAGADASWGNLAPGGLSQGLAEVSTGETSLSVALAAALEDALDVADDVTQLASTVMERLGGGSTDGPSADIGAVTQEVAAERDLATAADAAPASAESWQNAWNEAMDKIGQQVNYWLGKGVSQAQLTVHGDRGEAVDVRVLLRDGQAHLEFATDNALTRANIAEHGTDALRAALAQSGIELASLSVDSQSARDQPSGDSAAQDPPAGQDSGASLAAGDRATTLAEREPMVYQGSRSLVDAYA